MGDKPKQGGARKGAGHQPTKEEIMAAREQAGLNMSQAAALIYCSRGTWVRWESGERRMHPAMYELFMIKSGAIK